MAWVRWLAFFVVANLWSAAVSAAPVTERMELVTTSGPHAFQVEVMRTQPELEKGLMFRRSMPSDHGMLFDFQSPQPVIMWMKNTYLPLDMVFFDAAGTVINIARNAEPMSEALIPSGGPTLGVLELNAGAAKQIGLKVGDKARATIFPAAQ